MADNKGTGKKVALGAAIAGAVGFVTGILTAPKSGKETRKDIKDTATRVVRDAEKKLKELHSDLSGMIGSAEKELKKQGDKAKAGYDKAVDAAKNAQQKAKEVLSALHDGGVDDPELKKALKEVAAAKDHLKKYLTK